MKKISILIIFTIIINISQINLSYGEAQTMSDLTGYSLYQERVTKFCSEYKINDSNSEIIYLIGKDDQFLNLDTDTSGKYKSGNDVELAKTQYRKNMDGIYDCATKVSYYRGLKTIKKDLINKNASLKSRLEPKLDAKIFEIEKSIAENSNKCKITSEKNNSIIKKSILKQTTYELCKYNFYLEYLKSFNENISTLKEGDNKNESTPINSILKKEIEKKSLIQKEIDDSYKVYPIAFKAYSEYENNITIHILLELLREDYNLLREGLHKSINPINQVVYKISNAMSK
ncbi:MAG: hypothetical protein PHH98_00550 [Candidatus Gracilibacteria bacterium]|nr:hypothetical protein [Candidatus Gracilibacteria bacterium]